MWFSCKMLPFYVLVWSVVTITLLCVIVANHFLLTCTYFLSIVIIFWVSTPAYKNTSSAVPFFSVFNWFMCEILFHDLINTFLWNLGVFIFVFIWKWTSLVITYGYNTSAYMTTSILSVSGVVYEWAQFGLHYIQCVFLSSAVDVYRLSLHSHKFEVAHRCPCVPL